MVVGHVGHPDIHRPQKLVLVKTTSRKRIQLLGRLGDHGNLSIKFQSAYWHSGFPSIRSTFHSDNLTILNVVEMIKSVLVCQSWYSTGLSPVTSRDYQDCGESPEIKTISRFRVFFLFVILLDNVISSELFYLISDLREQFPSPHSVGGEKYGSSAPQITPLPPQPHLRSKQCWNRSKIPRRVSGERHLDTGYISDWFSALLVTTSNRLHNQDYTFWLAIRTNRKHMIAIALTYDRTFPLFHFILKQYFLAIRNIPGRSTGTVQENDVIALSVNKSSSSSLFSTTLWKNGRFIWRGSHFTLNRKTGLWFWSQPSKPVFQFQSSTRFVLFLPRKLKRARICLGLVWAKYYHRPGPSLGKNKSEVTPSEAGCSKSCLITDKVSTLDLTWHDF